MLMPMLALLGAASLAGAPEPSCAGLLDLSTVVGCAVASNPEAQRARLELDALAGRRRAAGTWLPGNPSLSLAAGDRRPVRPGSEPHIVDWTATLAQEFEVAGQRWARLDQVDAATAAQVRRVLVTERLVTATALSAAYTYAAALQGNVLASQLSRVATQLATLARGQVAESLLAPVDADMAQAESIRMTLAVAEAQRRVEVGQAILRIFMGVADDATVSLAEQPVLLAALPQDETTLVEQALRLRGEVAAAQAETQAKTAQIALLRRERVPNFTLSVYGSQDNAREWVVGGGLSLPITLPNPVGQSRAGEIAEAEARLQQERADVRQAQRLVRQEVARAVAAERAAAAQWALFEAPHLERARHDLQALGEMLVARKLSMREALLAQRSLIELLQSHIHIWLELALARVELTRASGAPFQGEIP